MDRPTHWEILFFSEFVNEFKSFPTYVQDELLAATLLLKALGPGTGRPYVATLVNRKHPNMKELRFHANNGAEVWRAAFAFDPKQRAIILVAADKQGIDEKRFYKDLLKKANSRYDSHLKNIGARGAGRKK